MDRRQLTDTIVFGFADIYDRVHKAGFEAAQHDGRYSHRLFNGLELPFLLASRELGENWLCTIPTEKLKGLYDAVNLALESNVEGGISFLNTAFNDPNRAGTKITLEEKEKIKPVANLTRVLKEYRDIQN